MNLELTSDQMFMRDEARRLLGERASSAELRKAIEAGGFDRDLWNTVSGELGWCAVPVPESAGGLGLGALELVLLAEETGRRLAPIPFWSTACVVAPMLKALGCERGDELLERIAGGEAAAVALDLAPLEPRPTIEASADGDGYLLDGSVVAADLSFAEMILVPALLGNETALFVLEAGVPVRRLESLDLTRPVGILKLSGHRVPASARIDRGGIEREGGRSRTSPRPPSLANDLAVPLLTAKLGLAAEQIGAAQGAFDMTLAYISERVQFGRTIASFQAVKHRCAALVVDIAEARSLVYGAATALDAGSEDAALEIDAAGALTTQALFKAAEEAVQLHGGVGNTWEYDPHLYLRRAQASAAVFGAADERLEIIAGSLLGTAA